MKIVFIHSKHQYIWFHQMYASLESPENLFAIVAHFKKTNVPLMIPCIKNDMALQFFFWKCKHKIKTRESLKRLKLTYSRNFLKNLDCYLLQFKNEIKMIKPLPRPSRNQNLSYDWSRCCGQATATGKWKVWRLANVNEVLKSRLL